MITVPGKEVTSSSLMTPWCVTRQATETQIILQPIKLTNVFISVAQSDTLKQCFKCAVNV